MAGTGKRGPRNTLWKAQRELEQSGGNRQMERARASAAISNLKFQI